MGDVASPPHLVRFGVFEVDLATRELRKAGVRLRVQDQPLHVLALLLERPGQVVTREELKRRLWAGTVVDFDHSINTTINKLREALGDTAGTPHFIETLPRRGYRFIYPVNGHAWSDPPVSGSRAAQTPERAPAAVEARADRGGRWRRYRAVTIGGAVVAVAAVALAAGLRQRVASPAAAEIHSVAVLPLTNASGRPERNFLADGITESLIAELGKIGALRVLSYASVGRYRGSTGPLPAIARELDVDALLVGDVVDAEGRVRIVARLVQASPERELWRESYEFDLRDVLATQKEIARDLARGIQVKVTPPEEVRLAVSRRIDAEAYEAYLLGRAHLARTPTPANWAKAKAYLERAIAKDSGYAPAYAALAELHMQQRGSPTRVAGHNRARAREWVEKALTLDDTLADAHTTLARIAQQEWDWAGAEREYLRALELNSSSARARISYAMFLYAMQRFDEAAAEARRAERLDPVSPLVTTWAGAAYFFAGRLEDAKASWRRALELDPGYADASLAVARTFVAQGDPEPAMAELRRALGLNPDQPLLIGALAHACARAGRREEALSLASELSRLEAAERGYVPPFGLIWAYAGLGDADRAFAALERAFEQRVDRMVWLNVDPLLAPLRSDPRFHDLVRRIGLPAPSATRAR